MANSSDGAGTPAPRSEQHQEEQRPDPGQQEPALTVAAVARRLGVAPATLRTWDRRYGLGPSAHTPGAHRRYTAQDLTRLQVMRQLTVEGVAPAEAAHLALTAPESASPHASSGLAMVLPMPTQSQPIRSGPAAQQSGGGRVVAMPGGTPEARGLARAALVLDSYACAAIVEAALEHDGVVATWDRLIVPVLTAVGERWAATGEGVEVEHLLAEVVTGSLSRIAVRPLPRHDRGGSERAGQGRQGELVWRNGRPVLLACVAEELHVLPMHAVAAALAERDVASRVLGARTPVAALRSAVERSGPIAVMLWSQTVRSANGEQFEGLATRRLAPLLIAAGPGWSGVALPRGVHHANSLPRALTLVELALTGLQP